MIEKARIVWYFVGLPYLEVAVKRRAQYNLYNPIFTDRISVSTILKFPQQAWYYANRW